MTTNITIDDNLLKKLEHFKSAKHYQTNSQAISELVRTGLENWLEEAEDEYLLALAEERLKKNGPTISQKEMRKILGITQKDIDEAEADFD